MYLSPVYTAAPAVADERVGTVFAALDSLGIPYIRFEHDATATMEDCAAVGEALEGTICKNLFLCNRQQTAFLSAHHARRQAVPHKGSLRADRLVPPVLRPAGEDGGAAQHAPRLRLGDGAAVRHGASGAARDGLATCTTQSISAVTPATTTAR